VEVDKVPLGICLAKAVNHQQCLKPLLILFDSGASHTWINRRALPKGCVPTKVDGVRSSTLAGTLESCLKVTMNHVVFPEFFKSRFISEVEAFVFNTGCRYDAIVGRDVLQEMGLVLDFKTSSLKWDDCIVAMRPYPPEDEGITAAQQLYYSLLEEDIEECDCGCDDTVCSDSGSEASHIDVNVLDDDLFGSDIGNDHAQDDEQDPEAEAARLGYKSKTILPSKYEGATIEEVMSKCTHLSLDKQNELAAVLKKYPTLFSPTLGLYPHEQIHLDIQDNAEPHQSKAYTIPKNHDEVFKAELDRLVKIGVLEPTGRQEWISGTFVIPKKDGRVRWISDFRALNKALKRKVYPLPVIGDILKRRSNYAYLTKIDLSLCYYTYELDDESKDLCTIATPYGLFRYCRLPMGISVAPDIAQEMIEKTLQGIEDTEKYIDDVATFSSDWHSHLSTIDRICGALQSSGYRVNPLKCEWAIKETDFLGHWFTPNGVKPLQKKIDSIIAMQAPTNLKELRSFIGLVNYYRDMWPKRAHTLAPLTQLTGAKTFTWGPEQEQAFKAMKAIVATDALLHWPNHNLPFDIETDASDYQLGAVIKQNGRPVAYYSRKLNSAQKNYTTIEKELLAIVETLREFRHTLLGARIRVYTDHKNLTYKLSKYSTQRVLRWRLLLEEYGPTFLYKTGETNFIADALSRVPTSRLERESFPNKLEDSITSVYATHTSEPRLATWLLSLTQSVYSPTDHGDLAECLSHYPKDAFLETPAFDTEKGFPFHFGTIQRYQEASPELQNLVKAMPVSMRPNNNNAVGHRPVSPTLKSYDDRQAPPGRHRRVSMRPKYSKQAPPERYYRIPMGQYQIIYRSLNGEDKIVSTKELLPKVIQILS